MKNLMKQIGIAGCILVTSAAGADELWNNGDTDNTTISPQKAVADDFLVPLGAGWWLNSMDTLGLWLNTNYHAESLTLYIFEYEYDLDEPGDLVHLLSINDWSETPTGRDVFGYEEKEISANFDPVYLPSGRYFLYIEVEDQYAQPWIQLAREAINGHEAWELTNNGQWQDLDKDVSYRLRGDAINVHNWGPTGLAILWGGDNSGGLDDLATSDDQRVEISSNYAFVAPLIQIVVEGEAAFDDASLRALALVVETSSNGRLERVRQRIEAFNYRTGFWETLSTDTSTVEDDVYIIILSAPPVDYIEPRTRRMRTRISWTTRGFSGEPDWGMRADQVSWVALREPM